MKCIHQPKTCQDQIHLSAPSYSLHTVPALLCPPLFLSLRPCSTLSSRMPGDKAQSTAHLDLTPRRHRRTGWHFLRDTTSHRSSLEGMGGASYIRLAVRFAVITCPQHTGEAAQQGS